MNRDAVNVADSAAWIEYLHEHGKQVRAQAAETRLYVRETRIRCQEARAARKLLRGRRAPAA